MNRKICLGAAQFGLDYGIANARGKILKKDAFAILEHALKEGISYIDTAYSYGDSEEVIGDFIQDKGCELNVISKLPALDRFDEMYIKKIFYSSLDKLKLKKIYGYLIHKFEDFLKYEKVWFILESLKKEGLIQKLGFSLYRPQELDTLLERKISFDIIQLPFSVFDRRFENHLKKLNELGVEIHTRSVFLQGLIFLNVDALQGKLKKAKNYLLMLKSISKDIGIPAESVCLNFVLLNKNIDKVIIGIDNLEHLRTNLNNTSFIDDVRNNLRDLEQLSFNDEEVLLPFNWS